MFGNMTHASMGELEFKLTQVEFKASAANCVKVHCPKKDKREEGKQEVREGRKGEERKEDHLGNSNSATQRHGENKLFWADPYLIAMGIVDNITVVTNETMHRNKERSIPYVCRSLNVSCMTFDEFMIHNGWSW